MIAGKVLKLESHLYYKKAVDIVATLLPFEISNAEKNILTLILISNAENNTDVLTDTEKKKIISKEGISSANMSMYLKNLIKYNLIRKTNNSYAVHSCFNLDNKEQIYNIKLINESKK